MLPLKQETAQLRSANNSYKDEIKMLNLELTATRNDISMANKAYEHVCQDENTYVLVIQLAAKLGVATEPWESLDLTGLASHDRVREGQSSWSSLGTEHEKYFIKPQRSKKNATIQTVYIN